MKIYFTVHMQIDILLEILVGYFVPIFEFAIVIALLLHCVVRQVNKSITQILQVEFLARRSYVPIFVKIPLVNSIYRRQHTIHSDVKFATADQQWSLNVSLNDMRMLCFFR